MSNEATAPNPPVQLVWDAEQAFADSLTREHTASTYRTHTEVVRHGANPDESKTILTVQQTWGHRAQYEAPTWRRNRVVGIDPGELLDRLNTETLNHKRIIQDWARIEAVHGEAAGLAAAVTMYVAMNCEIDAHIAGSDRRFITYPGWENMA